MGQVNGVCNWYILDTVLGDAALAEAAIPHVEDTTEHVDEPTAIL